MENYEDIFQDLFFPAMLLLHKACSKGIFNVKQKSQLMCDLIPVSQRQTALSFWVLLLGVFICPCDSCLSPLVAYAGNLAHTLSNLCPSNQRLCSCVGFSIPAAKTPFKRMKLSPFFKVEIFSDFSQYLCIRTTAIILFFLPKCRQYLLPSLSLGFLSFPSVGVKTSSHVSSVISSYPTELVIPLLDDHSHRLCTRPMPVPYVGSWLPEISAQNCLQFCARSRTAKWRGGGMGKDFLLTLQKDSAHKSITLSQPR